MVSDPRGFHHLAVLSPEGVPMALVIVDSITPDERVNPPSNLSLWVEERTLQHHVAVAREHLRSLEKAADCLAGDTVKKRDELYKLLDYQRKRGFRHIERLHWALALVNWEVFAGFCVCAIAVFVLWRVL